MCGIAVEQEQCRGTYIQFESKKKWKEKERKIIKLAAQNQKLEIICLQTDGFGLGTSEKWVNTVQSFYNRLLRSKEKRQFPTHFILFQSDSQVAPTINKCTFLYNNKTASEFCCSFKTEQ